MTGFTGRRNHGRNHSYYIDGEKVPGVTTIINGGLPKPALVTWAARCAADMAIDNWDGLAALPLSERRQRLVKAPDEARDSAAARGTEVHALAERLARGDEVTVPEHLAGHVEACVRFLDDWQVRPVLQEAPVLSRQWKYGGTLDLIADLYGEDGDERWLLDWKTNKSGPFGDTALQLAAYRYADFTLSESGGPADLPAVERCGVVWLRADGYDLYPYTAGPEVHRAFLYVQQVAAAAKVSRDWRGEPLTPPARAAA